MHEKMNLLSYFSTYTNHHVQAVAAWMKSSLRLRQVVIDRKVLKRDHDRVSFALGPGYQPIPTISLDELIDYKRIVMPQLMGLFGIDKDFLRYMAGGKMIDKGDDLSADV